MPRSWRCHARDNATRNLRSRESWARHANGLFLSRPGWCAHDCDPACCAKNRSRAFARWTSQNISLLSGLLSGLCSVNSTDGRVSGAREVKRFRSDGSAVLVRSARPGTARLSLALACSRLSKLSHANRTRRGRTVQEPSRRICTDPARQHGQ